MDLVRRLAGHDVNRVIAEELNRQGECTAKLLRFNQVRVASLLRHGRIPRFRPSEEPAESPMLSGHQAARKREVSPSTLHRLLNDGFPPSEQVTPEARWRIRLDELLRARLPAALPPGFVVMKEAVARLGVSRQTVLRWVKRGKLDAVMIHRDKHPSFEVRPSQLDSRS